MSEQTALTVVERARIALGSAALETRLTELVKQSADILRITNADGYAQCHAARMVLKNERVMIEKTSKAARDDATKFSKGTIVEENRLIGIMQPEEDRLGELQEAWDKKIKKEKEAKIQAELVRTTTLRARIDAIIKLPIKTSPKSSPDQVRKVIEYVDSLNVSMEEFQEFSPQAAEAKEHAQATLLTLLNDVIELEEEKARMAAERIELARIKAEQDAENARIEEERKAIKAEQDLQLAENQRGHEEIRRIEIERQAEQHKIDSERNEQARLLKIETDKITAEWSRIDAEKEAARRVAEIEAARRVAEIEEYERQIATMEKEAASGVWLVNADNPVERSFIALPSDLNESSPKAIEQPEMERMRDWIIFAEETLPVMQTIAGKAYETMFREVLDKALDEINDRHS